MTNLNWTETILGPRRCGEREETARKTMIFRVLKKYGTWRIKGNRRRGSRVTKKLV
jgi:hypothetical protein